jgi:hypothetical protein
VSKTAFGADDARPEGDYSGDLIPVRQDAD